jgi:voltage-gated potassium channel
MPLLELKFDRVPRFILLLVAIIAELMLAPLLTGSVFGWDAARVLMALVLFAALSAVGVRPATLFLFVPALVLHLLGIYWGGTTVHVTALTLRALFLSYAIGLIVWHILRRSDVTIDTIAGAACAYTLLAVVWGELYILLEVLRPGSFDIPAHWRMAVPGNPAPALLYFSFITLTTVGYGDITPQWAGAAGLAAAEAVVGQLYLAVTIARLVGLHISQRR